MSENLNKLKKLLKDMFQLDQADLDFGIYRIMNQKRDEINKFMDNDLLPQVKEAFSTFKTEDVKSKIDELEKMKNQLEYLGVKPEENQKYMDLKKQIDSGFDELEIENEVFSHLVSFFSRYYKDGDFISLRRYKQDTYAIPYEGEEVKLHWANSDQYYIKTAENFRDYCFKTDDGKRVHFKLVEASTEKDNNKSQKDDRKFVLCEENFIGIENNELVIRFEYRPHSEKREKLNELAFEKVKNALTASNEYKDFMGILVLKPTEKDKNRTLFEKQLNDYTAKNTFDYFIHKDLGGFLRRELDFYIKNEVVFVDDWGTDDTNNKKDSENFNVLQISISFVRTFKKIANSIIRFLEQLENFQKKLWLKKKFVTETNYCLTVDKVPENLYGEIANNTAQIEEWKNLFAIEDIEGFDGNVTIEFLKVNPYLVIDTAHFSRSFVDDVLASFEDIENELNGLLIHSENFQALNLLQERYKEQIKSICIDPPYNTEDDRAKGKFIYKDGFEHSTWLTMMENRISTAYKFLNDNGIAFTTIDDNENYNLKLIHDRIFSSRNFKTNIIWHSRKSKQNDIDVSLSHNYVMVYSKNKHKKELYGEPLNENEFSNPDNDSRGKWKIAPLDAPGIRERTSFFGIRNPNNGETYYPPKGRHWTIFEEEVDNYVKEGRIYFGSKGNSKPQWKRYWAEVCEDSKTIGTIWDDVDTATEATKELENILGTKEFETPKPASLIQKIIQQSAKNSEVVLDYFAGSGTTGHAVINLNREDEGNRKYILVEMGQYFDSVTKPRINKVIYSKDWKDGKPISREGSSHIFKYIRLESYEDTLNNLEVERTDAIGTVMMQFKKFREDYLLSYMLDVETRESDSLLNLDKFKDPFSYKLKIERNNETKEIAIDMVETFNYLIGLTVKRIEKILKFNFNPASNKLEADTDGTYIFKEVEGTLPTGEKALVIWRRLTDDINLDNKALDAFFTKKGYNPLDFEYDYIFVNGDNNLQNLKVSDEKWKVVLIEEEFKKRMFDVKGL